VTTLLPLDANIFKKMQKLVDERNQTLKKKRKESWLNGGDSDSSSTEDDSESDSPSNRKRLERTLAEQNKKPKRNGK
jgi:hypothetical protein